MTKQNLPQNLPGAREERGPLPDIKKKNTEGRIEPQMRAKQRGIWRERGLLGKRNPRKYRERARVK